MWINLFLCILKSMKNVNVSPCNEQVITTVIILYTNKLHKFEVGIPHLNDFYHTQV